MAIVTTRNTEEEIDQFTLSQEQQSNFIKMLYPHFGNALEWAEKEGYITRNIYKTFPFYSKVFNENQKGEYTEYYANTEAVLKWKSDMNKKGWSWVNENIVNLAHKNLISPVSIVQKILAMYKFKFPFKPYLTKEQYVYLRENMKKVESIIVD